VYNTIAYKSAESLRIWKNLYTRLSRNL